MGLLNEESVRSIGKPLHESNLKQVMQAYDSLESPIKITAWYEQAERKKNDYDQRRSVVASTQKQTESCMTTQNFHKTVEGSLNSKSRFDQKGYKTDQNLLSSQVSLEIEQFCNKHVNKSVMLRKKESGKALPTLSNWFCRGYQKQSPVNKF